MSVYNGKYGKNTEVREVATRSIFPDMKAMISSSSTWNQGDLLEFNASTHVVQLVTSASLGATFLGVSPVPVVDGNMPPVYQTAVDASTAVIDMAGPVYGSVYSVILKAGDAIHPGDSVYIDQSAAGSGTVGNRQVTVTPPMSAVAVGIYQGPALTAVSGGSEIPCLIVQNYAVGV
jgi:hypothetical protein